MISFDIVDMKLSDYGFNKIDETNTFIRYKRHNDKYDYDYIVEIKYNNKLGCCEFIDYTTELYSLKHDDKLTYTEYMLFSSKMYTMQKRVSLLHDI